VIAPPALVPTADPLAPVRETLIQMAARPHAPAVAGIAPGLTVTDPHDWVSAADLVAGVRLDELLASAAQRWQAAPHAAAALAWKSYSFWLALPAVLGYAAARRVPLLRPDSVVVRWSTRQPFLTIGLTAAVEVAILPNDPLALSGAEGGTSAAGIRVVPHEPALLDALRGSLLDEHLTPLLDQIRGRTHVGRRTMWGSLASGVAHGLSRAADVVPGPTLATAEQVLASLGVADLVELGPREGGLDVQRKTCCLAFTLPEPKVCSGCCIK
jgi:hypothetical protein